MSKWAKQSTNVKLSDLAGASTVSASLLQEHDEVMRLINAGAERDEILGFINEAF